MKGKKRLNKTLNIQALTIFKIIFVASLDKKDKDLREKEKIIADLRMEVEKLTAEIANLKAQLEASTSGFGATRKIHDQQLQVTHCQLVSKFCQALTQSSTTTSFMLCSCVLSILYPM